MSGTPSRLEGVMLERWFIVPLALKALFVVVPSVIENPNLRETRDVSTSLDMTGKWSW